MKNLIVLFTAVLAGNVQAEAARKWNSVYTDLAKDCVVVSSATDQAEIDFSDSECKAFGGYQLNIAGGDIRYHAVLRFNNVEIPLSNPGAFHDMGSEKVEWVYSSTMDASGSGEIQWRGLIYRLGISNPDGHGSYQRLYAVRLDGARSCTIGSAKTNEKARQLVYHSRPDCR